MSLIPDRGVPITLALTRKDGTVKRVRLGVAVSGEDGLTLQVAEAGLERLRELLLGRPAPEVPAAAPAGSHASIHELEQYAARARRTLADPSKARWHERERAVLAAIEEELARRKAAVDSRH